MQAPRDLVRAAESLRAGAVLGDFSGVQAVLSALRAAGAPLALAWELALRTQLALVLGEDAAPTPADLEAFVAEGEEVRRAAGFAAWDLALASLLTMNVQALAASMEVLARLACDDLGEIDVALATAFHALLVGRPAPPGFEQLGARAGRAHHAAAVVYTQAVRALFALESREWAVGLELARRSSLMGRTEGIPHPEFFANLALVRARRDSRQAHLGLRIVEALMDVVPRPWHHWVEWESALAGGAVTGTGGPARQLADVLDAAARGDHNRFRSASAALRARVGDGLFGRELDDLVAAIDPDLEITDPVIIAWRRGQGELPRPALEALALRGDADSGSAIAYVLVRAGQPGVRLLEPGVPLAVGEEVTRLPPSGRSPGRVETLLAVIALVGPAGIDDADCFARVYGFPYVPEIHGGVFDVLVHRARNSIDGVGQLERQDGRLALALTRPALIADPRMSRHMTDRVLRLLAQQGKASAKQASLKLRVSLRAVQGALNELAKTEACVVHREGRHVTYGLEDTVFSKPTLRFRAAGLAELQVASGDGNNVSSRSERQDARR
jgi:hypothetical protein